MPDASRAKVTWSRGVWTAAIALVVVSVIWSFQYPFWPNREELLDQGKIVDYSWIAFGLFIGGIVAWLVALAILLPALKGKSFRDTRTLVVGTTVPMLVAFTAMYPTNAIDVYIYAVRSRLLTEYGENPNKALPETYWDVDPYMRFASQEWASATSPYGPLWNQIAAPVTTLAGDSIAGAVIGFKLLCVIAVIGVAWLIYDAVKRIHTGWALPAALFWMWNPLVLWDGIGNAHNDLILMVPVIAALWAWTRGYHHAVIPLLLASLLIKYVTAILVPLAVIALWRRHPAGRERLEGLLWAGAAALGLAAISLFPFYDVTAIRESAQAQGVRISSSLSWWAMATSQRRGWTWLDAETTRNIAYALAAIAIGICAWITWRRPGWFPRGSFEAMFAFMLIASTNQRGWYVIWLVPLAAILIPQDAWRRTLVWSVTSLAGHASSIWLWFVWDWDSWERYWYTSTMVAVVFVPVLAMTAWDVWKATSKRGDPERRRTVDTAET